MNTFEEVLALVKRLYPELDAEEQEDIANDWLEDIEAEVPPDTDCIEHHMPAEYFTERG